MAMANAGAARATPNEDIAAALAAERAREPAARFERADLLHPDPLRSVLLAPDSSQIAFLLGEADARSLWLFPTDADSPRQILARTDATALHWSQNSQWLFVESAGQLAVIGRDGSGARRVARLERDLQFEVLGRDPVVGDALLLLERTRPAASQPRSRLLRVRADGETAELHVDERLVSGALIGADRQPAFIKVVEAEQQLILHLRKDRSASVLLRCVELQRCTLLATDASNQSAWLASDVGRDRVGLLQLGVEGEPRWLFDDPRGEADSDQFVLDPQTGQPRFAALRSVEALLHPLDADAARHLQRLQRALPGADLDAADLDIQLGHGDAAWLIGERGSTLAVTRWHLYQPSSGALRRILAERDGSAGVPSPSSLARKLPFSWRADDGMLLHGFLSVPPGRDLSAIPLVTQVHGGPWSATDPGYGSTTQLLVNRGYAVFEPNFRGSTGFGREYLLAAKGDYGNGRVQRDIVEGTRAVLALGVGDAKRVGIIGASFGGYAALQGVTHSPDLYRVALAAVPPADFGWALRWALTDSDLADRDGVPLATRFRLLGVDPADPALQARLTAQSPQANAALLSRPVLLFAGGRDERVAIRSVTHYAATLRRLGREMSVFIEPEAGHSADRPLTRDAFLYLTEWMLQRHLDGAAPGAPDAALTAHLDRFWREFPPVSR
jgi:dipeptidyl aminopeptidase/acylaminoacyl peptidase